jgi:hypothetical protein
MIEEQMLNAPCTMHYYIDETQTVESSVEGPHDLSADAPNIWEMKSKRFKARYRWGAWVGCFQRTPSATTTSTKSVARNTGSSGK